MNLQQEHSQAEAAQALTYRVANVHDAECLAVLMAEMDNQTLDTAGHLRSAEAMRDVLAEMARYPDCRAWLVLDGDTPVASFTLLVFRSPSHNGCPQALLDGVVVTASRRGHGIGEAMLTEAMQLAREAGCYKLALSSNMKRQEAHRFYEALGFVQHGVSLAIDL